MHQIIGNKHFFVSSSENLTFYRTCVDRTKDYKMHFIVNQC